MLGVCSFKNIWFTNPNHKQWLETYPSDDTFAKCKACNTVFSIVSLVERALKTHARGQKHVHNMELLLASSQMSEITEHFPCEEADEGSDSVDVTVIEHKPSSYFTSGTVTLKQHDFTNVQEVVIVEATPMRPDEAVQHITEPNTVMYCCHICGIACLHKHLLEEHMKMVHSSASLGNDKCLSVGRILHANRASEMTAAISKRDDMIGTEEAKAVNAMLALTDDMSLSIADCQQVTLEIFHANDSDTFQVETTDSCNFVQPKVETVEETPNKSNDACSTGKSSQKPPIGEKHYKCGVCDTYFVTVNSLKLHMWIHKGEKSYKCGVCDETFVVEESLKVHVMKHVKEMAAKREVRPRQKPQIQDDHVFKKSCLCDFCGKALSSKQSLETHMRKHKGDTPFQCDECGTRYTCKSSLSHHKMLHKRGKSVSRRVFRSVMLKQQFPGHKPYICDECGLGFSKSDYLIYHKRKHTGEKPYKCNLCGHQFAREDCFKRHARTHSDERPFKCDICNMGFAHHSQVKPHRRTHTGEKPYACGVCGAAFARQDKLKEHSLKHTGHKPYKCAICGVGYTTNRALKKHKLTHGQIAFQPQFNNKLLI